MKTTSQMIKASERRPRVAAMYLAGKYQSEIAAEFGVNQSTISRDLEVMKQAWQESALVKFDEIKARELARIDELEREYWQAWQDSKEDAETVTEKMKANKGKVEGKQEVIAGERTTVTRGQTGNPSFLQGVQWCIEQRLKIFGVYAAVKSELTGADGGAIRYKLEGMTDEELEEIANGRGKL